MLQPTLRQGTETNSIHDFRTGSRKLQPTLRQGTETYGYIIADRAGLGYNPRSVRGRKRVIAFTFDYRQCYNPRSVRGRKRFLKRKIYPILQLQPTLRQGTETL